METNQQNQDEIEIDLLELLRVLWSKIGYVILAALALGLLMVLVSKVFMKPQYESTTKMYVLSKQDSSSTVTSGDLQASSLLTKDYAELIQSRQVVETVIAQLNLDLTYEEFLNKITVTTQNDTRILSITVKDEDPYVASQMADAIRVAASDHIQNVMNTEAVNVVDEANIPDEPDLRRCRTLSGCQYTRHNSSCRRTEKEQEEKQKRPWKKEIREDTERESGSSKTGKIRLSDCGSLQISSDQPSVLRRR